MLKRQTACWIATLLLLALHMPAKGARPTTEMEVFHGSSVVALVTLGLGEPLLLGRLQPRGVAPFPHLRPCRMNVRVLQTIKGLLEPSASIFYLSTQPTCGELVSEFPLRPGEDAIVYLVREQSRYRLFSDSSGSVLRLGGSGAKLSQLIGPIPTPETKLAFVWLYHPLMIRPRNSPSVDLWSHSKDFWSLAGQVEFIQTMARVWPHVDVPGRESICSFAAKLEMCTGCQMEILRNRHGASQDIDRLQLLEQRTTRALRRERLEDLDFEFVGGLDVIREALIFRACHSRPALRQRARYLLGKHFPGQRIPQCIPCK